MAEETEKKAPGKKRGRIGAGVWILVGILAFIGLVYLAASKADLSKFMEADYLWKKLGRPVSRTVVFISIGLLVGQLIESLGWTAKLGRLAWPLIGWARLPATASAAFTSAFVSGVMANTLLLTGFKEGKLEKRSLIMANLLNASIPAYVLHMPTTMFIIISLTGTAGMYYVGLTFAAAVLRLVGVALVGRLTLPVCVDECDYQGTGPKRPFKEIWAETWTKFKTRLKRVVIIVIPVYLAVVLVAESGFFDWLQDALAHVVSTAIIPIDAMSVVVFSVVAEFTSGFAAAGALLQSGALSVKHVVLALLVGNIVATPVRALRHQLPHYMGIYSPGLGAQLLAIGQSIRIASVVLVGVLFLLFY